MKDVARYVTNIIKRIVLTICLHVFTSYKHVWSGISTLTRRTSFFSWQVYQQNIFHSFRKNVSYIFQKSFLRKKKFLGFSGKFFLKGDISGKCPPGDFRGTPGKISGDPGNSRKIPENFGGFSGFPGWKRGLTP